MNKIFQLYLVSILLISALVGCKNGDVEYKYPKTARDLREERVGSLVNESPEGGIILFGSGSKSNKDAAVKTVNNYLWYAALDVLDFMPIQSSDSAGGVLVTDWYEHFQMPGERFKINVVILGSELKAEAIKVKVFKQRFNNKNSTWRDVDVNANVARELEDKILIRARQLRIAKDGK